MIYFDNAATTRPNRGAVERAMRYLNEDFFNPSSLSREGFAVHKGLDAARAAILSHIAPSGQFELIFTASGSEADNTALFSCARRGNLVTTEGEHAAVYNTARELMNRGIEVRFARLNRDGSVDAEHLLSLVDEHTSLVSVIHVNNETGAVNDVAALAARVKEKNASALFHSDGVQAFGKIPFVLPGQIDLYAVSAHKIGGVRGAAALIKRKNLTLRPLVYGGGQENGLRSGTENVFADVQFCYAAEDKFASLAEDFRHVQEINGYLRSALDASLFEILSSSGSSPYILALSARGLRGEVLLHMLDDEGLIVGTGSACSSKNRYSRVMLACGLDRSGADGVLRLSFCPQNTLKEAKEAAEILNRCARALAERMK